MAMDYTYKLRAPLPGDQLQLTVTNLRDGKTEFAAIAQAASRAGHRGRSAPHAAAPPGDGGHDHCANLLAGRSRCA